MKTLKMIMLGISLSVVSGSQAAWAVCGNNSLNLTSAAGKVQTFIQEMKIAKARGDIETMTRSYLDTYEGFLKQCTAADYQKLCAFDCHVEIGEYNLFMANELSYYYTTSKGADGKSSLLKPEAMMKFAQDGVSIMENARQILSTQSSGDFRDYIGKGGRYNLLLARLYMTIGDIWYQSVSELKLERLQFLINDAANVDTAHDGKKSEVEEARANYEKANWVIQSAAMELPMDDVQFADLAADIFAQRYDTQKRLESLNKGFIFLNIDPEEFVQTPIATMKLRLNEIAARVESAERTVEALMTAWQQSKLNRSTDQINDEARKKEISVSQSSYRVAQLEGMAQGLADQISGKLDVVKNQQQTLDYEKQKFEYEFGLKMKIKELRDRQELIAARKDADIVQFDLGDQDRKLNELRWLMGWEISLANLEIQVSQFESELKRYRNEIDIKKDQIEQVKGRKKVNAAQIQISQENTTIAESSKNSLRLEKEQMNLEVKKGLEAQICAVRNRMRFLGMQVSDYTPAHTVCQLRDYKTSQISYHDQMCGTDGRGGLRTQLVNLQIKSVAEALCLLDKDAIPDNLKNDPIVRDSLSRCDALYSRIEGLPSKSQLQLAKDIWKREMDLAQEEIAAAEANRLSLIADSAIVTAQLTASTATFITTSAVEEAAEAAYKASLSIPEIYTCVCGMASGASTKTPSPKDLFKAALETIRDKKKSWMSWTTFLANGAEELRDLEQKWKAAADSVAQGRIAKDVTNLHGMQAMVEILGKSGDYQSDLAARMIEKGQTALDCDRDTASLSENQASLQAEFDRLITEVNTLNLKDTTLQYAMDREDSAQLKESTTRDILTIENANLDIDIKSLNSEITTLGQLITDTESRKAIIVKLQGGLQKLQDEADATKLAIDELERMKKEKLLAISDAEYQQINKVIQDQETYTKKLVSFADQVKGLNQLDAGLREDLNTFKQGINAQVAEEREKIMNTIYMQQQDANSGQKQKLFMATEEQMAAFTKSVPAFIQEKRVLMEQANRLLVLLRNQVNTLVALQGDANPLSLSKSDPLIYVKNKDDLQRLNDIINDRFWQQKQQIVTQSSHIVIPSGSGLARTLASERKASFEISPFARGRMKDVGYFSLWNSDFDADEHGLTQNLLLIDLNMLVDFPGCANKAAKRFVIRHKGEGVVFKETSDSDPTPVPSLITTEARGFSPTYAISYAGSLLSQTVDYWTKAFFLDTFLTDSPPNMSSGGNLPAFIGLPVLGQYEITLPPPAEGCTYENASFDLWVTYATKQRSR